VVESWRPDITVLGHNVLQRLFEYALDRNELASSLAISLKWIDGTTMEVKLRQGCASTTGSLSMPKQSSSTLTINASITPVGQSRYI
jgi:hypothetical protein